MKCENLSFDFDDFSSHLKRSLKASFEVMLSYRNSFKRISSDSEGDDSDNADNRVANLKRKPDEQAGEESSGMTKLEEKPTATVGVKKRKVNNIWASVMSENLLTEDLGQCGLRMEGKYYKNRDVENYDYTRKALDPRPEVPLEELIVTESGEAEVSITDLERKIGFGLPEQPKDEPPKRKKLKMEGKKRDAKKLCKEIARKLKEPKDDIIFRAIRVLGKQRMLEFLHQVEEIEENGGMKILNGSRRRTPGGILFFLLKGPSVSDQKSQFIFDEQRQHRNALRKTSKKVNKKMEKRFRKKMEFHKQGAMETDELKPLPTRLELLKQSLGTDESSSSSSSSTQSKDSTDPNEPTTCTLPNVTKTKGPDSDLEDGEISD